MAKPKVTDDQQQILNRTKFKTKWAADLWDAFVMSPERGFPDSEHSAYDLKYSSEYEANFSDNAKWLWAERYFVVRWDSQSKCLRKEMTVYEVAQRVARSLVCEETIFPFRRGNDVEETEHWGPPSLQQWLRILELNVMHDFLDRKFMFASPVLFNAGFANIKDPELSKIYYAPPGTLAPNDYARIKAAKHKNQMMCSCFTLPVNDMLESDGQPDLETEHPNMGIFNAVTASARISQTGGGVGLNFSKIRPKGSPIGEGDSGYASGPVSFMKLWDTTGEVIVQGGRRRAALMGILDSNHPDIMEFIDAKTQEGVLPYFNISVNVKDNLVDAIARSQEDGKSYILQCKRWGDEPVKELYAKDIWDKLCKSAWTRGDPGFLYIDMAQRDNLLQLNKKYLLNTSNPCGEKIQPLMSACILGSINLERFADDIQRDWLSQEVQTMVPGPCKELTNQIIRATYYMDLMVDASTYPLKEIEETSLMSRPLGLGVMGLADLFLHLKMVYGDDRSVATTDMIMSEMAGASMWTSIVMGALKDPFPDVAAACELLNNYSPAQIWTTDKALNHSLPLFNEHLKDDDPLYLDRASLRNLVVNKQWLRNSSRLTIAPTGSISMLCDASGGIEPNFAWYYKSRMKGKDGITNIERVYWHPMIKDDAAKEKILGKHNHFEMAPWWVTANELHYMNHLNILKVCARYVDVAISKTINLPFEATVEDVDKIYRYAIKNRIKGLTVYRDGSRREQPLEAIKAEETKKEEVKKIEMPPRKNLKQRPPLASGLTNKTGTPWGSLYTTLTFDEDGKPFEVFVSLGKSGSELKSFTEALSRVISVALRSGACIEDILNTLDGLSGKEIWVLDDVLDKSKEYVVRSIPDALAKSIRVILRGAPPHSEKAVAIDKVVCEKEIQVNTDAEVETVIHGSECPECNSPMITIGGCPYCLTCGYSKCK